MLIGFLVITIFDVVGSFLSRILNFEYVWLTFGSFAIYGIITLYIYSYVGFWQALGGAFIVGVYDSTIGLLIAKMLKANIKEEDKIVIKITPSLVLYMGVLASLIGFTTILLFSKGIINWL